MPFFVDGNPTPGEISEAINYLLGNSQLTTSTNIGNGQITDAVGNVVSYLYKYIQIKYADSFDGTLNFSNTPTSRQYYGVRNSDSSTESTNPADYVWTQVTGGFSTTKQVFYSVTGGRRIDLIVDLAAPSPLYQADSGSSIDLDVISGSDGASSRICYAKSTSTSLSSTPSTYQTSGSSSFPPTNTWGGAETWQATPPTLAVNEALFQSDGIYNPMTDLTTWNAPYLSNLKVGSLSAISANLGTITAGSLTAVSITGSELTIGVSPAISGNTMTGSGAKVYTDGRFALGNSTGNIVFNGTAAYLNGFVVTTESISGSAYNLFPLNNDYFLDTGTGFSISSFDATKPFLVNLTAQLNLGLSSSSNTKVPESIKFDCWSEYRYSTNNGSTYTAWTHADAIYRVTLKDMASHYTSISGYDRNFQNNGSASSLLTIPSNTTNLQFRIMRQYQVYGDIYQTTQGYFGSSNGGLPYANVSDAINTASLVIVQIKV